MNGFLYVASQSSAYYKAAVHSAISLRDNYPEANITLFTHEVLLQESDRKYFDKIETGIPIHKRAKMYAMARTPYENTLYLDADTEIRSENIKKVFDILGKNDIMFTRIIPKVSKDTVIDRNNNLEYHGGVILYNSKKLTLQLMQDWYETYLIQDTCQWDQSPFAKYNPRMKPWDQFTIWYLLNADPKYKKVKHAMFPSGGHSYNFINLLENYEEFNEVEQIVYHYTIPRDRVANAFYISPKSGFNSNFN
jgi:hypothetical protein